MMKDYQDEPRKRAIVIGGSMAGLLAARALADHYKEVLLLERDHFPTIRENRRGVPQGAHTHGLLASGRQVLERWFPGISNEMLSAGALTGDIVREGRWFFEGGCHNQPESGLNGLLASRPFLEFSVRECVRRLTNVRMQENCQVNELLFSSDNRSVTGVKMDTESLPADLVVDATGRGSRSPRWLQARGYPIPREDRIEVALGYTTRFFRRCPQELSGNLAAIIPPTPTGKRGGVMLAQEGNRWTVTLISHFGNYAPRELDGFIEFARQLPAPYIYEVIRHAEPLGPAASARFPASVRHRYERLKRFPEGYLVFGDAIASFNPIYGQGMSVAALQSVELDGALREGSARLASRFFARAAKVVDVPWSIAAGNDLRMPEATGERSASVKLINWYMAKLHRAAHQDPTLVLAFHKVANLLAAPPSVMHPRLLRRVLFASAHRHEEGAKLASDLGLAPKQ